MKSIVIQLICPDQKGIIAQLTSILYESNNNILSIEQHVDKESKKFYIRILVEFDSKKNIFPKSKLFDLNQNLLHRLPQQRQTQEQLWPCPQDLPHKFLRHH